MDSVKKKPPLYLIKTTRLPILEQLQIEEALLHTSEHHYCCMNEGSPLSIVMGLSNKANELLFMDEVVRRKVPVFKRFSGGGTVIVDENTLFVSFIFGKEHFSFDCYPEAIMRWNYQLYQKVFDREDFTCKENDFILGEKKCAGNAQYIKQHRWMQHSAFLWDYADENLSLLQLPKRAPQYRQGRPHGEFLTTIKTLFPSKQEFFQEIEKELQKNYTLIPISLAEVKIYLEKSYRKQNIVVC